MTAPRSADGTAAQTWRVALRQFRFSRTLKGMEVHFTNQQEAQLSEIVTK